MTTQTPTHSPCLPTWVGVAGVGAVTQLLTTMIFLASSLWAQVNFTGTWKLDAKASSVPEAMLDAQGLSWLEKQAAKSMPVTHKITQGPGTFSVVTSSALMGSKQDLVLGADFRERPGDSGRPPYRIRAYFTNGGNALAVETLSQNAQGQRIYALLLRSAEGGGNIMRQKIFFRMGDGPLLEGVRVFRREP